jgi:predicted sulfurtransferase
VKFIIDNWMLFAVALGSATMLFLPQIKGAAGGTLTSAGAVQLINREKAVVIDVSDTEEFAAGHINNAKNVPFAQLEDKPRARALTVRFLLLKSWVLPMCKLWRAV